MRCYIKSVLQQGKTLIHCRVVWGLCGKGTLTNSLPKICIDEVIDMAHEVAVPHGEEKIMVELTVKEAIALTGIKFNEQPDLLPNARKKLKETVESKMLKQ